MASASAWFHKLRRDILIYLGPFKVRVDDTGRLVDPPEDFDFSLCDKHPLWEQRSVEEEEETPKAQPKPKRKRKRSDA